MSNSENYYKELSLFNNIKNSAHRAWNRLITISRLKEEGRELDAKGYIEKLPEIEQVAMSLIALKVKKKGFEYVRAELNRGLEVGEAL